MSPLDLVASAQQVFPRLAAHTAGNEPERFELLAAGVSVQRVAALYPFTLDEHLGAIARVLQDPKRWPKLAQIFGVSDIQEVTRTFAVGMRNSIKRQVDASGLQQLRDEMFGLPAGDAMVRPDVLVREWALLLLYFKVMSDLHPGEMSVPASGFEAQQARKLQALANGIGYHFLEFPLSTPFSSTGKISL